MSPIRRLLFLAAGFMLASAGVLSAAEPAGNAEIKRITDRYALTKTRISALLDQRLNPVALPTNPPNPFYQPPREVPDGTVATEPVAVALVPEGSDLSDIDTLRRYAATLKIGGVIIRNGQLHLTVNNTTSKAGDVITVGNKDRPTYLKMLGLSSSEFILGLNDATLVVPLKK